MFPLRHRKSRLPLKWELALVLAIKMLLLYAAWALWFAHPQSGHERAENVARIILNK